MSGSVPLIPLFKFTDAAGKPLALGWVTVYEAGTTTPTTTYQDEALTVPNTNPIHLDANGETLLWLDASKRIKLLVQDKNFVTVPGWPVDNISVADSVDNSGEILTPEDFGARSADDGAIIAAALADSVTRGCTVRFTSGTYNVTAPIMLTQGMRVEIPGGVIVKAAATFAGLAVFVLGDTAAYNEWMAIEGRGTIDAGNHCNYAIDIRQGSRCRIARLTLANGILGGLKIGTESSASASVENDINGLHIEQAVSVQNNAASIGLAYENATDCFASQVLVRGYRTGVRVSATSSSVDLSQVHVWAWSTNGAMTRGFDLQGQANCVQCYADTPFDVIGLGGDLYGFYLHGFACQLTACKVFMNTNMGTIAGQVDQGSDGRIILVAADRETFARIDGIVAAGANTTTRRFKQLFGSVGGAGFFASTTRAGILDGGPSTYTVTTDREVNFPSQAAARFKGAVTVEGALAAAGVTATSLTATGVVESQGILRRNGAAGTGRDLSFASSGADRIILRLTSDAEAGANAGSNLQILRRDDAGAALGTPIQINRATGRVSFNDTDIQVRGTWDFPFNLGAYALWVNVTSGKLYIKNTSGGVPTSDTDGTVVGTQA